MTRLMGVGDAKLVAWRSLYDRQKKYHIVPSRMTLQTVWLKEKITVGLNVQKGETCKFPKLKGQSFKKKMRRILKGPVHLLSTGIQPESPKATNNPDSRFG